MHCLITWPCVQAVTVMRVHCHNTCPDMTLDGPGHKTNNNIYIYIDRLVVVLRHVGNKGHISSNMCLIYILATFV